jgi:hypothetical protein
VTNQMTDVEGRMRDIMSMSMSIMVKGYRDVIQVEWVYPPPGRLSQSKAR